MRNRIPPPILTILTIVAIAVICSADYFAPMEARSLGIVKGIAAIFFVIGLGMLLWAGLLFKTNKTTVNPFKPQKTSAIVGTGPYRFTRNPMYLGMALLIVSAGLFWTHWAALPVIVVFIAYMTHAQIKPEERALLETFSDDYAGYMQKVRRWL